MNVLVHKIAQCLNPVGAVPAEAFATQARQVIAANLAAFNVRYDQAKDALVLHNNDLAVSLRNQQQLAATVRPRSAESLALGAARTHGRSAESKALLA